MKKTSIRERLLAIGVSAIKLAKNKRRKKDKSPFIEVTDDSGKKHHVKF